MSALTDVELGDVDDGATSQHLASLELLSDGIAKIRNRLGKELWIHVSTGESSTLYDVCKHLNCVSCNGSCKLVVARRRFCFRFIVCDECVVNVRVTVLLQD